MNMGTMTHSVNYMSRDMGDMRHNMDNPVQWMRHSFEKVP
jgi:hypothetical protein